MVVRAAGREGPGKHRGNTFAHSRPCSPSPNIASQLTRSNNFNIFHSIKKNYVNGVDTFDGNGHTGVTLQADNASGLLDFSGTTLTDIAEVDAGGGNDTVVTALTSYDTNGMLYDGGSGNDKLQITLTLGQAENGAILADIAGYQAHIGGGGSATPYNFSTLGFNAVNFESAEAVVQIGSFSAAFDNVIIGTNGADTITPGFVSAGVTGNPPPTNARDLIIGNNGDDTIAGGGGDDIIIGGGNNDTMDGGDGSDSYLVSGTGEGFDTYHDTGSSGIDTIVALSDNTNIGLLGNFSAASSGIEVIDSDGHSNIAVSGDNNADVLDFSGITFHSDITILGNNGDDIITGTADADVIRGGGGNDTMDGAGGSDTYQVSGTGEGFDTYHDTGSALDTDTIVALSDNTNIGLLGDFSAASGIEVISADSHTGVKVAGDNNADVLDFSGVTFTGDITILGNNGDDTITGNGQDNVIRGGGNNDTMDGAGGSDTYQVSGTGEGFDTYHDTGSALDTDTIVALSDNTNIGLLGDFSAASGIEVISADSHTGVKVAGDNNADVLDFSGVTFTGDITILGNNGDDTITGNGQDNVIRGGGNNDTMDGAGGSDTYQVSGTGEGFDTYHDTGSALDTDTIVALSDNTNIGLLGDFSAASGIEVISADSHTGVKVAGDNNADVLDFSGVTFTGNITILGNNGDDTITGNGQDNVIRGGGNNDTMDGKGGSDTYQVSGTGEGFDTYHDTGSSGIDTIVALSDNTNIGLLGNFSHASSGIEVIDSDGHSNIAVSGDNNADVLDFSGITFHSDITIFGNNGDDTITGNGQDNIIHGGGNNDTIRGGAGDDMLYGDQGNDTFLTTGSGDGTDQIDGGTGYDTWQGSNGNDYFRVTDLFNNLTSIEEINGGGGYDKILGTSGADHLDFSTAGFTLTSIEEIDAGAGDDTVTGTSAADTIRGNAGDDTLNGGGGDDTFLTTGSGDGLDTIDGGTGTNTWLGSGGNDYFRVTDLFGNLTNIRGDRRQRWL